MNETTPTGIPIKDCGACNRRHPITRKHCSNCGLAHLFPCSQRARCECGLTDPEMPCLDCRFGGVA